MILHPHFDVNEQGHLTVGGMETVELAKTYGTPAYIMDENVIRENCRTYLRAARAAFGEDGKPITKATALPKGKRFTLRLSDGTVNAVSEGEVKQ